MVGYDQYYGGDDSGMAEASADSADTADHCMVCQQEDRITRENTWMIQKNGIE